MPISYLTNERFGVYNKQYEVKFLYESRPDFGGVKDRKVEKKEKKKHIYIVVSATDSIVSKIIRKVTGDKYAHSSISLEDDLNEMYSFGRIFPSNPFIGGFVKESVHFGSMKRFKNSEVVVIRLTVSKDKYAEINEYIKNMYVDRKKYHYNYLGLFLAKLGIHRRKANCYYCSEFIKELLDKFDILEKDEFGEVVRPVEFLNMKKGEIIYRGRLCDFAPV